MDYKPYTLEWTRKRALQDAIYDYLEDVDTSPEQICEDIRDVLEEWVNQYSSRAEKGKVLKDLFK
jgi:RNase adaptor protein for sRNA GlmZ degradation